MQPLIELNNVTIIRNQRVALDNVSVTIEKGENVAIFGPNGCGKSSLVKTITRDLYPYGRQGSVRVAGFDRWNLFDLRKILGIVSNELQAFCSKEVTGLDFAVSGFFGSYGVLEPYEVTPEMRDLAMDSLFRLDAGHLANRRTDELSSGEGRRVLIARALVHQPSSLLLDEPTTSLDIKSGSLLMRSLRKILSGGTNFILVTHHVEEILPEIKRVILMRDQKIFADGPTDEIMTSKTLSELFQTEIILNRSNDRFHARLEAIA